ncbi:endo-1,5-alpha-L-arabinase [Pyrenophora tritici-repentis Pt-1C-BFP]|uniref:Endo-1,5-alpha-L-arabinanase A n=1 Tax=Pyrenophora tritici-repentis (strain Pt-1C-BFP) TaxID=426418 RepID=B2W391_PYRTR|nr:endo-1,5-alpha-L-arabinase [Pyrenophora tritici-repentis Pt-1C-BFP]EDU47848.1 endo-1,5-alpha-L-arabinase [Pyrenophora tritici-repentis Pt-1C-BFP]
MRGFGTIIRDSGPARSTTALFTALLVTSATFLPLLIQGAVANPVPISLPDPQKPVYTSSAGLYPNPEPCTGNFSWIGRQDSAIGVATSKSLKPGTWVDHGTVGLPLSKDYNLIDPFIYQEKPDSPIYFTFGSYWNGIYQVELFYHDNLLTFGGWAQENNRISNVIRNTSTNAAVVEGATMHKEKDFYYMFYSVGQCCNIPKNGFIGARDLAPDGLVYHVVVCRSKAPNGPFQDRDGKSCLNQNGGTTILASHGDIYAPGGQGIMIDPRSGRTVMYYHYVRPSVGYAAEQFLFGYNYLDWKDGWPVVVGA